MRSGFGSPRAPRFAVVVALLLTTSLALAVERRGKRPKFGEYNPDDKTVEMFSAIDNGEINVKLIPKDSTICRVMIENKTKRPLNVKLPDAFAGVPVLAQRFGGRGMGGGGMGGGMGGGQSFGGGMGGMGGGGMGGMGGGGGGGGMFNVTPEKVGTFKVTTVCLEHGKDEPRPRMKYEIKPIAEFTDKTEVHELCRMLGIERMNQRAAQVAAWHLNGGMSFEQLAAKRLRFADGTSRPYFTPQELHAGMQISAVATKLARQRQESSGENSSASLR